MWHTVGDVDGICIHIDLLFSCSVTVFFTFQCFVCLLHHSGCKAKYCFSCYFAFLHFQQFFTLYFFPHNTLCFDGVDEVRICFSFYFALLRAFFPATHSRLLLCGKQDLSIASFVNLHFQILFIFTHSFNFFHSYSMCFSQLC